MILADNNILSSFSRVGAMDLLLTLFRQTGMGVTPAVNREVLEAIAQGCVWLEEIRRLLTEGELRLIVPTQSETLAMESLPGSLGAGERESISVCQARKWGFLTNDKRARNFCRQEGIQVYDLNGLLRALWVFGACPKETARRLADGMEAAEGMVIRNKEAIFRN